MAGSDVGRPDAFEVVELAHFGAEDVDDHIASIDQNPVGIRQAFDADLIDAFVLQLARDVIGEGRDVAGRAAGSDDHGIGHRRFSGERNRQDVLGLVVVELLRDDARDGERIVGGSGGFNCGWLRSGWLFGSGLARRLCSFGGGWRVGNRGGIRLLPAPGSLAVGQGFDLRTVELTTKLSRGGRARESEGMREAEAVRATEQHAY